MSLELIAPGEVNADFRRFGMVSVFRYPNGVLLRFCGNQQLSMRGLTRVSVPVDKNRRVFLVRCDEKRAEVPVGVHRHVDPWRPAGRKHNALVRAYFDPMRSRRHVIDGDRPVLQLTDLTVIDADGSATNRTGKGGAVSKAPQREDLSVLLR